MYLASDRKEFILKRLADKGSARTIALAKEMNVTDETVRNDLITLEKSGLLRRVHGGAISLKKKSLSDSMLIHTDIDVGISKKVMQKVHSGMTVFIDGGPTGHLVASYLPAEPVSVVTNSPTVVARLENNASTDVYCTGGLLDRRTGLLVGRGASDSIKQIGIDLFVIIPDSFCPTRGLGFISLPHAEFTQEILKNGKEVCVLCPSAKLGASATYYTPAKKVTELITNDNAPASLIKSIEESGIKVTTV